MRVDPLVFLHLRLDDRYFAVDIKLGAAMGEAESSPASVSMSMFQRSSASWRQSNSAVEPRVGRARGPGKDQRGGDRRIAILGSRARRPHEKRAGAILVRIESAFMPGSNTPKLPASQTHSWRGCQRRTSSFHSIASNRAGLAVQAELASSTAALYCECQVAKITRPRRCGASRQVEHLRDRRRRRLLQHDMLAGRQRLASDSMAHVGRRADRDRVDIGQRGIELRGGLKARDAGSSEPALADDSDELESRVLRDDG